jgi:rhodanese-related sulfurtransferase
MKLIARDELRRKLERHDEFRLVMTLSAHSYEAKRIPTSLNFATVGAALAELDPEEDIVVYCSDASCSASIYAYYLLEREGYSRVRRYAGGLADWETAGLPLEHGPVARGPRLSSRRAARPWSRCA